MDQTLEVPFIAVPPLCPSLPVVPRTVKVAKSVLSFLNCQPTSFSPLLDIIESQSPKISPFATTNKLISSPTFRSDECGIRR